MAIVAWEGDPGNSTPLDGFSEALRFNGTTVDDGIVVAGSDPTIQPYDGTVNTSGVATSYGVDVDTFNVTSLLAPGQTSATTQFSAGGDLVLLAAQVVSATSEPVVDLSLTKTHTGNFTVGGTNVYTLTVANAAGWQREDNAVVVTDTLPAGLTYVSGVGTGWTCGAAAQVVTCTHPPTLNSGSALPPLALTVAATGAAVPNVVNTAVVSSASFDVNAANNTATDPTVVVGPNLSTSTKTVVDLNGGEPEPGDTVRYTITVVESAGVAATAVSVVDDLAAELGSLAVVSVPAGATDASTGAGTGANGTGRVNVTSIAVPANGSAAIVFTARIAAGTPPMTPIDNTATIANPGGPGAAPDAPQLIVSPSALPSSGSKPLYLRSTPAVALSRNPPGTDAAVTVAFGAPVAWTLTPTLALPVTLPGGNIAVPLWLRRNNNTGTNSRTLQLTLANTSTGTIGSATQTLTTLPSVGLAGARELRDSEPHGGDVPGGLGVSPHDHADRTQRSPAARRSFIPSARRPATTVASCSTARPSSTSTACRRSARRTAAALRKRASRSAAPPTCAPSSAIRSAASTSLRRASRSRTPRPSYALRTRR